MFDKWTPRDILAAHRSNGPGVHIGTFLRRERVDGRRRQVIVPEDDDRYDFIAGDNDFAGGLTTFPLRNPRLPSGHPAVDRWRDLASALSRVLAAFRKNPKGRMTGFCPKADRPKARVPCCWLENEEGFWFGRTFERFHLPLKSMGERPAPQITHKQLTHSGQMLCLWALLIERGRAILDLIPPGDRSHFSNFRAFLVGTKIPHEWSEADDARLEGAAEELLTFAEHVSLQGKVRVRKAPAVTKRKGRSSKRMSQIVRELLQEDAELFQGTKADLAKQAGYTSQSSLTRIKGFDALWSRNEQRVEQQRRRSAGRMSSNRNS